jgi:hypothetical protein
MGSWDTGRAGVDEEAQHVDEMLSEDSTDRCPVAVHTSEVDRIAASERIQSRAEIDALRPGDELANMLG